MRLRYPIPTVENIRSAVHNLRLFTTRQDSTRYLSVNRLTGEAVGFTGFFYTVDQGRFFKEMGIDLKIV